MLSRESPGPWEKLSAFQVQNWVKGDTTYHMVMFLTYLPLCRKNE